MNRRQGKEQSELDAEILAGRRVIGKFGVRKPSVKRRVAARTSWKRQVRQRGRLRAPRGMGWVTNPKKAAYNRVYNRTSVSADRLFWRGRRRGGRGLGCGCLLAIVLILIILSV